MDSLPQVLSINSNKLEQIYILTKYDLFLNYTMYCTTEVHKAYIFNELVTNLGNNKVVWGAAKCCQKYRKQSKFTFTGDNGLRLAMVKMCRD